VLFDQRDESMVGHCIEDGADDYVTRTSEYLAVLPVVVKQALGKRALLKREDMLLRELLNQKKFSFMGRLIQGIGHNINSPLASIMGRAQLFTEREERERADLLAKKDTMPPEEFDRQMKLHEKNLRDLNSINESATRLALIVKNMTYKRQQEQNQAIQYINLNDLLKEEFSFLEADMFFKHEVIKHYEFAQSLPHIKGVYSDFSQGLMAFVQNALEAMRSTEKKELTVRTGYNGQSISITIHHTGCSASGEDTEASHALAPVTGLILDSNPQELLKPYGVRIASASQAGDTTYTIEIPYNRGKS
jgi:signal transduction histidine kinase